MEDGLDKTLNRKIGFKYIAIDGKRQARLLRLSRDNPNQTPSYNLEAVPLANLKWTNYKALSYTWGQASRADIQEIQIDGQPFFIRRNLFDFLATATAKEEYGLFFIDAICINQLDHVERQFQVQEMARIYRNANEVIAWLGFPDTKQHDNVRALSQTIRNGSCRKDCATWTTEQWEGFRHLSYHSFWSRVWIVQEVLLASSMVVWCGSFTFPVALFGSTTGTMPSPVMKVADNGRPSIVMSASLQLRSPAETITTHRLRQVPRPLMDPLAQGTKIGTIEEMTRDLGRKTEVMRTYQSRVPDLLCEAVRKFGKLGCSDPRDRLYGLLGILKESIRAKVEVDYSRDVSFAYYQALKIGLQELSIERSSPGGLADADGAFLGYYCDARDAFNMGDGESLLILRQVLGELRFHTLSQDNLFQAQWQQHFSWTDVEIKTYPDLKKLLAYAGQEIVEPEDFLYKFHTKQRRVVKNLLSWPRSQSRRRKGWAQLKGFPNNT